MMQKSCDHQVVLQIDESHHPLLVVSHRGALPVRRARQSGMLWSHSLRSAATTFPAYQPRCRSATYDLLRPAEWETASFLRPRTEPWFRQAPEQDGASADICRQSADATVCLRTHRP